MLLFLNSCGLKQTGEFYVSSAIVRMGQVSKKCSCMPAYVFHNVSFNIYFISEIVSGAFVNPLDACV